MEHDKLFRKFPVIEHCSNFEILDFQESMIETLRAVKKNTGPPQKNLFKKWLKLDPEFHTDGINFHDFYDAISNFGVLSNWRVLEVFSFKQIFK